MSRPQRRLWHRLDPRRSLDNSSCILFAIAGVILITDIHIVVIRPAGGMIAIGPIGSAVIVALLGLVSLAMSDRNRQEQILINTRDYHNATCQASEAIHDPTSSSDTDTTVVNQPRTSSTIR